MAGSSKRNLPEGMEEPSDCLAWKRLGWERMAAQAAIC